MREMGQPAALLRNDQRLCRRQNAAAKSATMKIRDVLRILRDDGWYLNRTRGSHR